MRRLGIGIPESFEFNYDCLLKHKNLEQLWIHANSIEFEFIYKMVKQWKDRKIEFFHFYFGTNTAAPFHIHISVDKRPENQTVVGCPFSLYITCEKHAVSVSKDCRDVNELVIELKKCEQTN